MKVIDRISLFVKKEGFEPEAHHICPRFDKCSVNRCPLHFAYSNLEVKPEDKEKRCKMAKSIRHPIGLYFKFKNEGLTERELSGKKRWDSLSPEEKAQRTAKLKQNSPFVRLKKKGYGIVRVGKDKSQFTQITGTETPKTTLTEPNSKGSDSFQTKLIGDVEK